MSNSTTPRLSANTAGRNWIFASHPNHVCNVPVKSRNSRVTSVKQINAVVSLIVRNIISSFLDSLLFYVAKIVKGNDLQLIRITD